MKKNGPWTIKSSKVVYVNPWISGREDKVIRPDGNDGIFGVLDIQKGVSVLPIDDELNVYLIEEFRYALEKMSIETASGGIEPNETDTEAAKRELQEEAGIFAKEWIDLGIINPFTSIAISPQHFYIAKKLSFADSKPEGTEVINVIKLPLNEALGMVESGKITCAPSCLLILKAARIFKI